MQVILIRDVNKLGYADDICTVKPGFARNYLIPQGFAVNKTQSNVKILAERQKQHEKSETKFLANLQTTVDKLTSASVKIAAKVGSSDKIFGSVGPVQISEAIKTQLGVEVDRRKITVKDGEVKTTGSYIAVLALHKETVVEMPFEVIGE
jgi:large subunit ribosomal protein L9